MTKPLMTTTMTAIMVRMILHWLLGAAGPRLKLCSVCCWEPRWSSACGARGQPRPARPHSNKSKCINRSNVLI